MVNLCLFILILGVLGSQSDCCCITKVSVGPYVISEYPDSSSMFQYNPRFLKPNTYCSTRACTAFPNLNPFLGKTTTCTLPHQLHGFEPILTQTKSCCRCAKPICSPLEDYCF